MNRRNLLAALIFAPVVTIVAKVLPKKQTTTFIYRQPLVQEPLVHGVIPESIAELHAKGLIPARSMDVSYTAGSPAQTYSHTFYFTSDKVTAIATIFHVDHIV